MKHRTMASRYAKVLFQLEDNNLENLKAYLDLLKNSKILKFLKAPQIPLEAKKAILTKGSTKFRHFLAYLIEHHKLDLLPEIAKEYHSLVNEKLNIWEAEMHTAVPMEADVEQELIKKLERFTDKKVTLHQKVDPKMIGGAILIAGNEMIDWSIKGRLAKMKAYLLGVNR